MTALVILILAFVGVVALVVWADVTGFDPFASLYGTDYTAPDDVQEWRSRNHLTNHPRGALICDDR